MKEKQEIHVKSTSPFFGVFYVASIRYSAYGYHGSHADDHGTP